MPWKLTDLKKQRGGGGLKGEDGEGNGVKSFAGDGDKNMKAGSLVKLQKDAGGEEQQRFGDGGVNRDF